MNEDVKPENLRIHSRADELIACLEGEIAKRDEELAACRVAVENCEVFRARIVELEAQYQRDVCGLNNEGDPIGGDPAGGYANDNARLRAELSALKAQEPVAWISKDGTYAEASTKSTVYGSHTLPLYAEPVPVENAQVVMPERWNVPRPMWKDARQPYGNPLNHADIEAAEKFNLALDEVARLNAVPVRQVSVPDGAFASRAITHYEAALLAAFPSGSSGEVFNQWNEARRVLAAAPAAPAADAWIPVSERLPNIAQEVIVHSEFDGVCAGVLDSYGEWFAPCSEYKLIRVTSWMPMPTKIEANRHDQ